MDAAAAPDSDEEQSDQEAHEDEAPAASSAAPTVPRPTTKKELNALRDRFKNTLYLCAHLYKDVSLRDDLRMVVVAVMPYLNEYSTVLDELKASQD